MEHGGRWGNGAGSRWQWRLCQLQWALDRAGPWQDGGAGERGAPGQDRCEQGPNCLANHPADGHHQQQAEGGAQPQPMAPQMVTSDGHRGGAAAQSQIDCPTGRMVEQVRGRCQDKVGYQVGLQGCEAGFVSWDPIPTGHPEGPHLCRNSCTRPLVSGNKMLLSF